MVELSLSPFRIILMGLLDVDLRLVPAVRKQLIKHLLLNEPLTIYVAVDWDSNHLYCCHGPVQDFRNSLKMNRTFILFYYQSLFCYLTLAEK